MSLPLPAPGPLYAALQTCHPDGLPDWLNTATPRCATAAAPLRLDEDQAEELANLTAAAWWECQQDPDDNPLSQTFAQACAEALTRLENNTTR